MSSIEMTNSTSFHIKASLFEPVYAIILEVENLPSKTELNLCFVNDKDIKSLNKKFRGKNSVTDVLSFPAEIPGIPFLGDIVIDISYAEKQKGENSLEDELLFLFVHGALHLLGYDHISVKQAEIMTQKEKIIWQKVKEIK